MAVDADTRLAATFAHHVCRLDDVQIHYVIGGRGEPVVLLHGWPQTWFEWRRVMPTLAERYTVKLAPRAIDPTVALRACPCGNRVEPPRGRRPRPSRVSFRTARLGRDTTLGARPGPWRRLGGAPGVGKVRPGLGDYRTAAPAQPHLRQSRGREHGSESWTP